MEHKKILIVGAGPGGLSSAMQLAHKGFQVDVFEKQSSPGGRTSEIKVGDFKFDVGPTFFMMKHVIDRVFGNVGRKPEDYMSFVRLSPMYRLMLPDNRTIDAFEDREQMRAQLEKTFPGDGNGIDLFYERETKRYARLMPILERNNNSMRDIFRLEFFKAIPYFAIGRSLFDEMGRYFNAEFARLSFTFQSKYLGMSPWKCPGAFGLVPFIEHSEGVFHVKGGLNKISEGMARAAEEDGAKFHYNTSVKKIIVKDGKAIGIQTEKGEEFFGDEVIVNADFGYAMEHLFESSNLKKYTPKKLEKKGISCSIFMLYAGMKTTYPLEHNTIVFAKDYKKNVDDVFSGNLSGDNISFYIRNTSETDPDDAPKGKSALYILVPVPNKRANIDWKTEAQNVRNAVIHQIEERLGFKDFSSMIEVERVITPDEWEGEYNVYRGAVFNLAHNLGQMLWFRPHNKFEDVDNCYLVGGGTHPGSGLPTIFQSGVIAADLISKKYNK